MEGLTYLMKALLEGGNTCPCSLGMGRYRNNIAGIRVQGPEKQCREGGCAWEPCSQNNEKRQNLDALSGRPQDVDTT